MGDTGNAADDLVGQVAYVGYTSLTVSYTHLDVYKRQGFICARMSAMLP